MVFEMNKKGIHHCPVDVYCFCHILCITGEKLSNIKITGEISPIQRYSETCLKRISHKMDSCLKWIGVLASKYLFIGQSLVSLSCLNGRRIYGGYTPPLRTFLFLTSFFKIWKRLFDSVAKLSRVPLVEIIHFFRWMEGGLCGTQKGVVYTPHEFRGIFSDIDQGK